MLTPDGRGRSRAAFPYWPDFDLLRLRLAGADAVRSVVALRSLIRAEDPAKLGFENGRPGFHWAMNGRFYPHVPMFIVADGDLVKLTIVNDTNAVHPMHLHGHHVLVLSRNGVPDRGSPWWADTLKVDPAIRTSSPSAPTTRALDGSLPQPPPCKCRPHDAPDVRRGLYPVRDRRPGAQHARVSATGS